MLRRLFYWLFGQRTDLEHDYAILEARHAHCELKLELAKLAALIHTRSQINRIERHAARYRHILEEIRTVLGANPKEGALSAVKRYCESVRNGE